MNYLELFNTLKLDIPNLELVDKGFGTGIRCYTHRYPEGINFYTNMKEEYVVKTSDNPYTYQNIEKAVEFFVKKCQQKPAK